MAKVAKQEILLAYPVIWEGSKLHLVSAKIVHQDSTLMAKVRKVVRNVLSTPTCLNLVNRPRQTVLPATQIDRLEI